MGLPLSRIDEQYEIVAKIKEGGMGEIYKVRHRLLDELRIVKVLHSSLEANNELNERFAREARAAIRLRHPNIVQIFDFTLDDSGTGLIVMEYIRGADLKQLIAQSQLPSIALVVEIARQGLRALGYLHRHGFVHRDVSPDNLMLSQDVEGRPLVKVIDLGIAKQHGVDSQLTASGIFLGKFRYSSPEHFGVQGPGGIEARSDLYSFGLVLYELLTGKYPIRGESTSQLIGGHLFQPPCAFAESDPQHRIPQALRGAVLKTLAKSPDERFSTAEELITMLDEVRTDHPLDSTVVEEASQIVARATGDDEAEGTAITQDALPAAPAREDAALLETARTLVSPEASVALPASEGLPTSAAAPPASPIESTASAASSKARAIEPGATDLDALVAEVDVLLQSGKLIEADRVLFQARESHGSSSELTTMKSRLDKLYQEGVENKVRSKIANAEALARDGELTRALEVVDEARAAAPAPLIEAVEATAAQIRQAHDTRQREQQVAETERRLVQLIQRRDLAAAQSLLNEAEKTIGSDALEPLRELLNRTVADRVQDLVQQAGVANDDRRFDVAASCLEHALDLDTNNSWIRDRLLQAQASQQRQEEEARRARQRDVEARTYLQQAKEARAGKDILKARLLVAQALELRPDDGDAAALARSLDQEHRAAELQVSALRTMPLSPGLMKAFTDIEAKRAAGDPVAAWRLLGEAIAEFGEIDTFVKLRRQIAEEVLDSDG